MAEGTLVVRRRALGDVVLIGAVTSSLPGPVTVVTEAPYVEIARRLAGVDRVLPFGQPVPRSARVIDLQADLRTRWAFPRARRIRKHSISRRLRLWQIGTGRPRVPVLYGRAAGVRPGPAPWIHLDRSALADTLVLVPAASTALKTPPTAVLISIGRRWPGPVVAIGGPEDATAIRTLLQQIPSARGRAETGFEATFAALAEARVVVGGDTGLLHLAAAAGVPTVVLVGPTHPDDGFLQWPSARLVQRPLPCRPCTLHRGVICHRGDRACMAHDPDDVWRVVEAQGALGAADR